MQYITLCLITIIHVSREQAKLFAVSTSCPIFIYLLYFQVDIFAMDLVVVPVHLGMHWCLAVRSHFTFSPRGIETALTVADSDLQIGGGGGGGGRGGPPGHNNGNPPPPPPPPARAPRAPPMDPPLAQ